jgi:hypothetical protein
MLYISIILQIAGTATRESIPDVPMFSASPAKWLRRDNLSETITAVGQTIASALTPVAQTTLQLLLSRYKFKEY